MARSLIVRIVYTTMFYTRYLFSYKQSIFMQSAFNLLFCNSPTELCIKEGELTGELPPEIPLAPGEPVPAIRRRVGTEFALPETLLTKPSAKSAEDEMVAR